MTKKCSYALLSGLLIFLPCEPIVRPTVAEETPKEDLEKSEKAEAKAPAKALIGDKPSVTLNSITINGHTLDYTAPKIG